LPPVWLPRAVKERREKMSEADGPEPELVFSLFDPECTGQISISDASKAARGMGYNFSNNDFNKVILEFGDPKTLNIDDFKACLSKLPGPLTNDRLVECFKLFDKSGSGQITGADLRGILTAWSQKLSNEEAYEVMKAAGYSDGSSITYSAFVEVLTKGTRAEFC